MLKIGHRGASGYEPENTLLAFKKAVELGMDMIELDVHLSKDNELIVIHDETLNRTTTGKGKISQKTLAEIKKYKTKKKNQEISTLSYVLDELLGKIKINIEIKEKKAAKEVAALVKNKVAENEVLFSSNYVVVLKTVKKILPAAKTALIYFATKSFWRQIIFGFFTLLIFPIIKLVILKRAKSAGVEYVNLFLLFATKIFVSRLHQEGFKVIVWTVNQGWLVKKMIKQGVDGLISDYPNRIK